MHQASGFQYPHGLRFESFLPLGTRVALTRGASCSCLRGVPFFRGLLARRETSRSRLKVRRGRCLQVTNALFDQLGDIRESYARNARLFAPGRSPRAWLIAIVGRAAGVVLPIREGMNLIGRSAAAGYVREPHALAGVIEGAQWRIVWTPETATVEDAGSTNGSALVAKCFRDQVPRELGDLRDAAAARWLGWDGVTTHSDALELHDGDVLVNVYGSFLYRRC